MSGHRSCGSGGLEAQDQTCHFCFVLVWIVAEGTMTEIRKLAAILAADVIGYSRLAGSDEDRTLARLVAS